MQLEAAKRHTWGSVAVRFEDAVTEAFGRYSDTSKLRRLIDNSDYYAAKHADSTLVCHENAFPLRNFLHREELETCYEFTQRGGTHHAGQVQRYTSVQELRKIS